MPLSRIGTNSITNYAIGATDLANNSIETYTSNAGRPLTNRNLVINGAMQVAQRNTSVTGITTIGYYTADRWRIGLSSAGTWTMNVESSAPTGTEFRSSANIICTTADSSLDTTNFLALATRLEGQNCQGIKKGTANAESLTVSFWVKSSNTGTYICELFDVDNERQISKSYTIDAANTWEKKTITFPPDTTGQLDNDNGNSFNLGFWLAAGSTYSSGTLNDTAWASNVQDNRAVGQLNLANLAGNYWAITGIQLETGTVATPYEWMDYGTELAKCQRYFVKETSTNNHFTHSGIAGGGVTQYYYYFPVEMRTTPTGSSTGTFQYYNSGTWNNGVGSGNQVSPYTNRYGTIGVQYSTTSNFMPTDSTIVSFQFRMNGGSASFSAEL